MARTFLEPKTRAGRRTVALTSVLRGHLREHQLYTARRSGLVFGSDGVTPPNPRTPSGCGHSPNGRMRSCGRSGSHQCRHTFASLMIAAGVNAKALSTYMGHSSVTITYDRYGHLMPGNEGEAAELLDEYLAAAAGAQTGAQGG